jgi:polyhydroxyalkanoate synthesis regulator phasin
MSTDGGKKLQIAAGVVAGFLVAVALGAVGALGISSAFSDDDSEVAAIEEASAEPADPADSLTEALEYLVDSAVAAGRLTEEEGERLKESLESGETLLPRLGDELFRDRDVEPFDRGGEGFMLELSGAFLDLEAAAEYLDVAPAELEDELQDGKTLAEIAGEQGKSVEGLVQTLVDAAQERIDEAVADGRLSEESAARLKEDLEDRIRDRVDQELRLPGFPFELTPEDFGWPRELEPRRGFSS